MANGRFLIGKPAGGVTTVTMTDGASNTNLVLPESGTVATLSNIQGFKNLIINGRKQVNQRGLTSTDNSYNQDRWYKAGNNWFQGIEGDNNLISGKTYTLSWVGSATASYYIGNATSSTINSQTFTPITKGGSFTLTVSAGQNLWIKFLSDATGSTFNFAQLEEGSVATPFENRPYGLELSLCQRYLPVIAGSTNRVSTLGQVISATTVIFIYRLTTNTRIPVTGLIIGAGTYSLSNSIGQPINATAVNFVEATTQNITLAALVAGGLALGNASYLFMANPILLTGAEL